MIAYEEEHKQMLPQAAKTTVEALCRAYIRDNASSIKGSSLYEVENRLNNHIIPVLGDKAVTELTASNILAWQNGLLAQNYSRSYVVVLRYALSAVLTYGRNFYDLSCDALSKVKPPRDDEAPKEMQFWTPTEFSQFLGSVENQDFKLMFETLFLTGMRKGEVIALSASDINGCTISVSKSITRKTELAWQVTTPKTKESIRKIKIPQDLAERLRAHEGKFIFGGPAPFADRTIDRAFRAGIEASGVKPIRIHDLRHSHASYLISQGCSIVAVSKRLGHKSTRQTLDTYAHFFPEDEDKLLDSLKKLGTDLGTH